MTQFKNQGPNGSIYNAVAIDPRGWQCSFCEHCAMSIARRIRLEGRHGRWRHQRTGKTRCDTTDNKYPARNASPVTWNGDGK